MIRKKIITTTVGNLINSLYKEVDSLDISQKKKSMLVYIMLNDILARKTVKKSIFKKVEGASEIRRPILL